MIETIGRVRDNIELAPGYKKLTLRFNENINVRAGQFAMLRARNSYEPLLRRALAVYQAEDSVHLSFLYQVMGRGTAVLADLKPGGEVDALLPLGKPWPVEAAEKNQRAIVVAGGIGTASVLMLCKELMEAGVETEIFFGVASERAAAGCGLDDFRATSLPLTITTDDGSLGEHGLVTGPLSRRLAKGGLARSVIYSCGPWAMMRAVAEIANQHGVICLVSLEAPMGCGFGVCVGCVVAVTRNDAGEYGSYKRVCVDGPVFSANDIRWDVVGMTH